MTTEGGGPRLRVIVWGINYSPELTGIAPYNTTLCEHLHDRGHEVEMVTTFAYYPAWRKNAEDEGPLFRTDDLNGVPVHRCWHYVPAKLSAAKRIVHEASFVSTSFARLLLLDRPDVLVVVSPPLLLGAAAWLMGGLKRTPFVFHVQDLQPDAALSLGMLKPGALTRALYRLEALAYRTAGRVSGISAGMLEAFAGKGVPEAKRVYFPNPVVLPELSSLPFRGAFRARHGFHDGDFVAIYSGNLGTKQGLGVLLDAAAHLRDIRVKIVICGDGAEREALAARAAEGRLPNVLLLPLQERRHYEEMLVDADVCLITQQKGSGRAFFPSKLLNALAFARPVLTVADDESELARALKLGGFGVNVLPNQPETLARELEALALAPAELAAMSERGRLYVSRFSAETVFERFEACLQEVAAERSR